MTPLRAKMLSALRQRNYAETTIKSYIWHIRRFAEHFHRCPSQLTRDDIQSYLLKLIDEGLSFTSYRQVISAMRFLYCTVLERKGETLPVLPFPRKQCRKIPTVPSVKQLKRMITRTKNVKERALIATLYGVGIRTCELRALKISDIDSERMLIKVSRGKWDKSRVVPLPRTLLKLLREYYRQYRPKELLFEGSRGYKISAEYLRKICRLAAERAQLPMRVTPQLLRHCFATHRYENDSDLFALQQMLGHSSVLTTRFYTQVSSEHLQTTTSPLDEIL